MEESATDRFEEALRASGRRLTHQRRLILQVLEESDEHLDAEALHARVRLRDDDISLATVYRTLSVLKEMDLIEEHRLGEGHSHYEAVRGQPHYHFVCLRCGKVIEFDAPLVDRIEQQLCDRKGVRVTRAHLRLMGYCAQCREEVKGESDNGKT